MKKRAHLLAAVAVLSVAGCQLAYFVAMEQIGYHKRDLLVSWVAKAVESQVEAKEQFNSALDQFRAVVNVDGGELEEKYEKLNNELEASEGRADAVRKQVQSVEDVAAALFGEWESELDQYSNATLRQQSATQLARTKADYKTMIGAMRRAESKMDPVLAAFRDQVLFLKHNLNAKAVASLKGELASVQTDIGALVREMENSIAEANEFIQKIDMVQG